MKPQTIEQTKAMLAEILERGSSCEAAGRPYGVGRSTVERNVKTLIALAARERPIAGLDRDGWESLSRLRQCARAVMDVVCAYTPRRGDTPTHELTSEDLVQGASRIRARSHNANRDVALMYAIFCTGAKPIELAQLRVRDYLEADGRTREESVMPASAAIGGRQRPLYFASTRVREALDAYLLERSRSKLGAGTKNGLFRGLDPDSALFLTDKGTRFALRPRSPGDPRVNCPLIVATLRATFKRAGWVGVTAQAARRQVASRLAAKGAHEDQLCSVLGLRSGRSARRLLNHEAPPMAVLVRDLV